MENQGPISGHVRHLLNAIIVQTEIVGRLKYGIHDALVSGGAFGIAPRTTCTRREAIGELSNKPRSHRIPSLASDRRTSGQHFSTINAKVSAIPSNNRFATVYRYTSIRPVIAWSGEVLVVYRGDCQLGGCSVRKRNTSWTLELNVSSPHLHSQ